MGSSQSAAAATAFAATSPLRPAEETIDKLSKWKKKWDDNYIGWHQNEPHRLLLKFGDQVIPSFHNNNANTCQENIRVFVPLCGKTVDMAFLANHPSVSQVVGIDGIKKALDEFATENPSFEIKDGGDDVVQNDHDVVERMTGNGIELLRGDLFDLNENVTNGKFGLILDRGSVVAIQPTLREKYVETIGKLIQPGGKILLVTFDRRSGEEEAMKRGPPFSVNEKEVRRLYEGLDWVESLTLVDEHDEMQDEANRQRFEGLESMYELCFIITAKQ